MTELNATASPRAEAEGATPLMVRLARRPIAAAVALAVITLAVYASALRHEFVDYDDGQYVVGNPQVQAGLTWAGVQWAFRSGEASNWHPLTWLSHMLDVTLFGARAGGHHFTSIALHALNAALAFWWLRSGTGRFWPSLSVAALFALHPLRVESVAWVSERKDVLSACFGLLSLWAYGRYAQTSQVQSPKAKNFYAGSLGLLALGLMSKPMLVTLPCAMLLLDYWPLKRVAGEAGRGMGRSSGQSAGRFVPFVLEKIPFFALCAVSSVVTFVVQKQGGAVSEALPLGARVANALVSYARYLRKTFWPDDLSVLYPHPGHWPTGQVVGAALLLAVLTVLALIARKRLPFVTVGWLWFAGMLVPVIGLVQVGIQSMADRYTYLPSLGLFIALVWGAETLSARRPALRPVFGVLAILGVVVCARLTRVQLRVWADSETLFRHAVAVTRDNYLAHNNLGYYLSARGRKAEALTHYEASLRIRPDYADARNNLGHALAQQGQFAEAIEHYRIGLRSDPQNVEIRNNLGNALAELGQGDAAIAEYEFVLQRKPDHADAHNNLGIALAMKGRLEEAMGHFREALRLKPGNASAHGNLGNAFAARRQFAEATHHYREALRLSPTDAQTRNNLGNVLAEQGRLAEAVTNYQAALALKPQNPEAHFNLGCVLVRLGRNREAREHLEAALELKPDYAEARRQLQALEAPGRP